ncbi:TPA: hypothetical protein ACK3Q6_004467 [Burkholderia cepacia]
METDNVLAELERQTTELVGQNLRSKAVVVARLGPLIDRANELGYTHETIHKALTSAGLTITFGVYKTSLHRWRERERTQPGRAAPSIAGSHDPNRIGSHDPESPRGSHDPDKRGSHDPRTEKENAPPDTDPVPPPQTGDVFEVRDALQESRRLTGTVDYAKLARDRHRKSKK